nr:hypothetical protein [Tanacetum cinerariifolium]
MRTLASVEIEIMLILRLLCCLNSSSVRSLKSADRSQSSRVPVPLPEDAYEAIKQAYLIGTDTESEPFKGEAETSESPHPHVMLRSLRVLARLVTARMAVRVPPTMSPSLSAGIAEVAAMSDSTFGKRFRSFYDNSPSPTLPIRKRYRGTSELILDTNSENDEEVEESLGFDSESEDAEDEGPIAEDEDPAARDEGLATGYEGPGMGV